MQRICVTHHLAFEGRVLMPYAQYLISLAAPLAVRI